MTAIKFNHTRRTFSHNYKQLTIDFYAPASMINSAWKKGVLEYAFDIIENNVDYIINAKTKPKWNNNMPKDFQAKLLDGAHSWSEASFGGCYLLCNDDIALRLCNYSELKRLHFYDGRLAETANAHETWLDVQARALTQAYELVCKMLWSGLISDGGIFLIY